MFLDSAYAHFKGINYRCTSSCYKFCLLIRRRLGSVLYVVTVIKMGNHVISECSKPTEKEYKSRHEWVRKGIHWELCKRLKLTHARKRYMHKPESVQENEKHKILFYFKIKTVNQISTRSQDQVWINKNLSSGGFGFSSEMMDKYSCQVDEKAMGHEGDSDTNCYKSPWSGPQRWHLCRGVRPTQQVTLNNLMVRIQ